MSSPEPIVAKGLGRQFGDNVVIEPLDVSVDRGQRVGIVGADGAGKTTLLQMLAGILDPTVGECRVLGFDTRREAKQVAARIGYMSQGFTLYDRLSVKENLSFAARIRDVPDELYRERSERLLSMSGLGRFTDRPAAKLSGGMRKKLSLCTNLVHEPELLILDEPGLGVDPLSRRHLWTMLDRFRSQGLTMVVATSYMDEAERCDRILLLEQGRVLADGSLEELLRPAAGRVFTVNAGDTGRGLRELSGILAQIDSVHSVQWLPDHLRLVMNADIAENQLAELLPEGTHLAAAEPRLEDLFVLRTDRRAGEQQFPELARQDRGKEEGLVATGLSVRFGHFKAVDRVSFEAPSGELLALLGPNGAGKTTLIRALCGLVAIDEGNARVAGVSSGGGSTALRRQIGYMSQRFSLYLELTPWENLRFFANAYGLAGGAARAAIDWAREVTGLTDIPDKLTGDLSSALRQRLALACSLLHRPRVLFLDEPTSGVDPVARYLFWRVIRELAASGMTVLVTTHYLEEAAYCDRLALMLDGRLLAHGSRSSLNHSLGLEADATVEMLFTAAIEQAGTANSRALGP
ncbi:ATP-binding cassette domain-containing protein [Marinobacter flavimaris]|jgi:ABC-2 type transport system ATP-binding protein|uniref:ABC transporter ATP-binding protein n=1 Tax=Marinobacter flavimaris TaxID=262076 RepID=A0A3D8GXD1_9GAMM|nr:ATP-binding cassette domain-containing protein [Marinobacter flavimaris]MCP4066380.1 ABC transporter ATP-binding protein [Gammaproteobacteria bacterium]PPI78486.1 heme ABC exporter ATP-binding protein CcmA [Marinobacter flavimaris]RDU39094.1 ABC transporter ATP-binding protein [Marinobacter flavimaris]|tara:strand:- start:8244 stop:9974 length:1731 start_codon:yes stop_codon:yes gene_type:complete